LERLADLAQTLLGLCCSLLLRALLLGLFEPQQFGVQINLVLAAEGIARLRTECIARRLLLGRFLELIEGVPGFLSQVLELRVGNLRVRFGAAVKVPYLVIEHSF